MNQIQRPVVTCQMMIRKPVSEVFQAFVDPRITTKFWYTKSSGPLTLNQKVTWEWEMYGVSDTISVVELIPNKKIKFEWDNPPTTVAIEFSVLSDEATYVVIKNDGFHQSGEELITALINNTGGFTTVLDGLKAYLEFGIELNLIKDKFPPLDQK